MNLSGTIAIVSLGVSLAIALIVTRDHSIRLQALEASSGTVTIIVPADLRKLPCVPMQYLLSNRRISEIHSYSKDLKFCKRGEIK